MDLLTLLGAGAVAGIMAGLLGIGGGVIIVPVLSLVRASSGVHPDVLIKVAVGTSLATIVVTATTSIYTHHRKGAVEWQLVRYMTPGVMVGAVLGAVVADAIPGRWMIIAFVIFMFGISLQMGWGRVHAGRSLPGPLALSGVSTLVGALSALLGIGGGALHVPFLAYCGVPVKRAIATAAAVGFPLAVASTLGFVITGLDEPRLPEHSLGYINLPAFGGVVAASIVFAPLGAWLAHQLPEKLLKRGFAVFLFVLGARMAYTLI